MVKKIPSVVFLFFLFMLSGAGVFSYAGNDHISLIDYDESTQLLFINIVAPHAANPIIYLNSDGILSELNRFEKRGEHNLVVYLPCDDIKSSDQLIYKAGDITLSLPLDSVYCKRTDPRQRQPRIIYRNSQCTIDPKGTTLWRIGLLFSEKNGFSVYQNMYAIFLFNRNIFIYDDITKMKDSLLLCPPEELIASIDRRHAVEMFQEAEAFRLVKQSQSHLSSTRDDPHSVAEARGGG